MNQEPFLPESLPSGVVIRPLGNYKDARGHLTELFRQDELPEGFLPSMAYISVTHPGIGRGPHEHEFQSDLFCFVDGDYDLYLWENRPGFDSWSLVLRVGSSYPCAVIVPPGVVHGYKNVGDRDAFVLNFPDKLYAGWGRSEPVDEIRHESDPDSPFHFEN
jgi:dTDP-4-dehydrorhamnose 3,5-epimerase